jgi:hypothetical protein
VQHDLSQVRNLKEFAILLLRLDSLSNVLVWSKKDPSSGAGIQIDLIEFPRLHLTFEKRKSNDGSFKYFCVEQSGLFLATTDLDMKNKHVLTGLPHAVLLCNTEGEYHVLLPATAKPTIIKVDGDKFSYQLSLNRMDEQWLQNTGETGFFVYPVHSSGGFLSSKSVASTLYLLLFRTLMRKFNEAVRLVETCVCDTAFTPQEQQIYAAFGSIDDTLHPETHAMRLKLFFVTYGFSDVMPFPFNYRTEMLYYIKRLRRISAPCRLSPEEEAFILNRIKESGIEDGDSFIFENRLRLVKASFNLFLESYSPKAENNLFKIVYPNVSTAASIVDEPVNLELLDTTKPQFKTWIGKFAISKYHKPEGSMVGVQTIQFLLNLLTTDGIDLRGKSNALGFFFLYELMNDTMPMRILPEDRSHDIGCMLLRTLTDDAIISAQGIAGQSQPYALLRIMAEHPLLAAAMPAFEDKRMLKLPSIAGLDIFQTHIKNAANYIRTNMNYVVLDRIGYGIPVRYSPLSKINGSPTPEQDLVNFRVGRRWVSPKVYDSNCVKREVSLRVPSLFAQTLSQLISPTDIQAFGSAPLSVIGLSNFVENKTLHDRGVAEVKAESPLEVLQHQSSRSHIARTSVARLEQDIQEFAHAENALISPVLKFIGNGNFDGREHDVEKSIKLINTLVNDLNKLKAKDLKFVNVAITEVVNATNGDGSVSAKRNNSIPVLRHKLYQRAGLESVLVKFVHFY